MMNNTVLADEMVALFSLARELRVGDLAVFTDYKGREIGCRVERVDHGNNVWCRVCGLETWQGPYKIGDLIVIDAGQVRRAV